jgi:hypothetical protein
MLSLKCSSLIDVLKFAYYNIHMDENAMVNLLAIETVKPKRRMIRSSGAVYLALLVLMIGCISVGNLLYASVQIPRFITQPILYALIAICGVILYRWHFICFRYTLTDEQFAIEQVGGNREKIIAVMMICDIRNIATHDEAKNLSGKKVDSSLPPKQNATWICATVDGVETAYRISASEAFLTTMRQQMEKLRTTNNDRICLSGCEEAQKE